MFNRRRAIIHELLCTITNVPVSVAATQESTIHNVLRPFSNPPKRNKAAKKLASLLQLDSTHRGMGQKDRVLGGGGGGVRGMGVGGGASVRCAKPKKN